MPADAGRGVEEPEAGCADVEQLEREEDDEHVEGAVDDRLGGDEPDDEADPGISRGACGSRRARREARRRSSASCSVPLSSG